VGTRAEGLRRRGEPVLALDDWDEQRLPAPHVRVATAAILFSSTYLYKWLGSRVLTAIERLMGMVIVAISVQMLLDGLITYMRLAPAA